MQNVFSPLLSVQPQQPPQMASQLDQESSSNIDLQMLMSTLEVGFQLFKTKNFELLTACFSKIFREQLSRLQIIPSNSE